MRFLLSLAISTLGIIFILSPWGESLDRVFFDSLFLIRGVRDSGHNIVIVAIDEASFDELDQRWPWPRSIHGKLLNSLKRAGAKVVGFDLLFSEPSLESEDKAFAESIEAFKNVVLVNEVSQVQDPNRGYFMNKIVDPTPILDKTTVKPRLGFANMVFDTDGFIRSLNLKQESEKSFSSQIVALYTESEIESTPSIATINFIGPSHTLETVSYYQALDPETFLPKDFFKDKIVLIGFVVASRAELDNSPADHYPIPFSKWEGGVMPGVEIHGHAVENFLNHSFINKVSNNITLLVGFSVGIIGGTLLFFLRPLYGALLFILIFAALSTTCVSSFIWKNTFFSLPILTLPFVLCYVASPIFHYLLARKEKAFIRKAFSQYLSPKLVEELIKNPDKLELGGEEREGTILFLDIAGFTALSETLTPKELISFVNLYLGSFADEIVKIDGMIDKYIGDCIMAVWGVPIYDASHAKNAVTAALNMKSKLFELNKVSEKLSAISFRAGMTSGNMLAGNVGGGTQFNYTVLGNEVNLASRLESLNKFYGTMILINARTRNFLDDSFFLRKLDEVQVKGQKTDEVLFELCGLTKDISPKQLEGVKIFEASRELYLKKDWESAIKGFEDVLNFIPEDRPSKIMIERCQNFIKKPPLDSWDGVHVMSEK